MKFSARATLIILGETSQLTTGELDNPDLPSLRIRSAIALRQRW
jgi:hypothetical protein